jgi:hypothetical protein
MRAQLAHLSDSAINYVPRRRAPHSLESRSYDRRSILSCVRSESLQN